MKGIIVFYVNHKPETADTVQSTIESIQKQNKSLLEKLTTDGYEIMYVPTVGEATRMERVLFEEGRE